MNKIRRWANEVFIYIKRTLTENRWIAILLALVFFFVLLWSFNALKVASEKYSDGNIITAIKNQDFNYLLTTLKILLAITAAFAFLLIAPYHFFLYLSVYLMLAILLRFMFIFILVSCILDGFTGYVLLFILWLPLIVITYFCLLIALKRIYDISGFSFKKKRPVCVISIKKTLSLISKPYLINIISAFGYFSLIVLILNLIF